MIFKTGESEIFEYNGAIDRLSYLEVFKEREHDCRITSCDFNPSLNLLMTADTSGSIRFWTRDKKYIREIQFPDKIDTTERSNAIESVCFLNTKGDILISHDKRISKINFETYWTKLFDYYGVTSAQNREFDAKSDYSLYSDRDYVVEESEQVCRVITTEKQINAALNGSLMSHGLASTEKSVLFIKSEQSEFKRSGETI